MIRIYVRKQNEESGHVFKSRYSVLNDKVAILPYTAVLTGGISEKEWANSQELISDRFGLYISETNIDGRTKLAKSLKSFTWRRVLEPSISRRVRI
jgi:hypothetical protein